MRISAGNLVVICIALVLPVTSSLAQSFSPLHTFGSISGLNTPLTEGPDGTLYGISSAGGLASAGAVFRVDHDGSHFTILHSFGAGVQFGGVYTNADGYGPTAGLVLSNNVLYGTTEYGGVTGYGSVFKVNTDGSGFTTLRFFTNGVDGGTLNGGVILSGGVLYGAAYTGGTNNGLGTVYMLNTDGSGFALLHTFSSTNGGYPMASMILSGGTLYGTTRQGNNGTVFKLDTIGSNFSVLHHFTATFIGTNIDGDYPLASLVLSGGTLYGTTSGGGRGYGTLFAVTTDGSSFTNLYVFTNGVDGGAPQAELTLSGNTLYGTAKTGGSAGNGTIFKINMDGTGFAAIYTFLGFRGTVPAGPPTTGLLLDGGTLIGAAGPIFTVDTNGNNITVVLATGNEGAKPLGGLVLASDTFYGTTSAGGAMGSGTIYKVNTNGTSFDTLYVFSPGVYNPGIAAATNSDGATPMGTLVLAGGRLYGTANGGGAFGAGTIFCVNTNGTGFTNFHSFTNTVDGKGPGSGLALGEDTLYGTTRNGGSANMGTIFKINTDGSGYQTIYSFTANTSSNTDGIDPVSSLVVSGNTLYGTASAGGTNGSGTLFKVSTNGTDFTVLYTFVAPTNDSDTANVNGANPFGGLILSGNTLYGTASAGGIGGSQKIGSSGNGTIFKINTDGSGFTRLYALAGSAGGSFDGASPMAGLALSGNMLYGTTSAEGNGGAGTVFQLDINGNNFAIIHTFAFQGGTPMGDVLVNNGVVYGTTEFSAPGSGSVFSVTRTAAPMIQFIATPSSGVPPLTVQFSAPGVDNNGNPILGWYWNFDDGTPAFTIIYTTNRDGVISTNYNYISAQNPLHAYTNNATYIPSLIATNNNGTAVIGMGPSIVAAYPSSILNGGFEAGSFTNWTRSENYVNSSISGTTTYKHSGSYGAKLYAYGTLGYLSQILSTTPGNLYLISFWLDSPSISTSNEFTVTWGGNMLMNQTNIPAIGWTNIQFFVTATSNVTLLQLGYRNDSVYFGLDDVSVISAQPIISSFGRSGGNLVLNNTDGISNHTYYVLESTNLSQPVNFWIPIFTNTLGAGGNFTVTLTNGYDPGTPRQYYILQMQ